MVVDSAVEIVANVVALNGGRLVGRTRFQKTMYLLGQLGVRVPFEFEYHHYGPYSAELADALDAAVGTKWLTEGIGIGYHDSAYSIFSSRRAKPDSLGGAQGLQVEKWLRTLEEFTGTDLELAATLVYLRDESGVPTANLDNELKLLKPVKASDSRLKRAWHLLSQLELDEVQESRRARA
jgi:hypothetical protein